MTIQNLGELEATHSRVFTDHSRSYSLHFVHIYNILYGLLLWSCKNGGTVAAVAFPVARFRRSPSHDYIPARMA
jgi:hypothetical protein